MSNPSRTDHYATALGHHRWSLDESGFKRKILWRLSAFFHLRIAEAHDKRSEALSATLQALLAFHAQRPSEDSWNSILAVKQELEDHTAQTLPMTER